MPAVRALADRLDGIEFVGVYPIYAAGRDLVYEAGFEALWDRSWDGLDPDRAAVV